MIQVKGPLTGLDNAAREDEYEKDLGDLLTALRPISAPLFAVVVPLAGPAAQRRFRLSNWHSAHGRSDLSRVAALTSAIIDTPRQARALLKFLEIRAEDILEARWGRSPPSASLRRQ